MHRPGLILCQPPQLGVLLWGRSRLARSTQRLGPPRVRPPSACGALCPPEDLPKAGSLSPLLSEQGRSHTLGCPSPLPCGCSSESPWSAGSRTPPCPLLRVCSRSLTVASLQQGDLEGGQGPVGLLREPAGPALALVLGTAAAPAQGCVGLSGCVCLCISVCECLPICLCLLAHRTVRSHSPHSSRSGPLSATARSLSWKTNPRGL